MAKDPLPRFIWEYEINKLKRAKPKTGKGL